MNSLEKILKWSFLSLLIVWGVTYSNQKTEAIRTSSNIGRPPIGGQVVEMSPFCPLPVPHITFTTVMAAPGVGSGQWNWLPGGTFPYSYGPVTHISQWTLGKGTYQYMPCQRPCFLGACPMWPHGGFNAVYTGTSV